MSRTFPVRCFAQLFVINLLLLPGVALAQSSGPSAEEQASYAQGLAAAKAGQYADAINKFTDVYAIDPKRSEVWLYLGLAQARTPGHEIRAVAWLQAYILANPNAPNASAIQSQINLLEDSIESRISRILDELETAIPKGPLGESAPDASDLQVAFAGYDARSAGEQIAASRLFLGDTQQAVRVLNETNGRHWPNSSENAFGTVVTAFMSAPIIPASSAMVRTSNSDGSKFVLETADSPAAFSEVAGQWNSEDGWLALACTEHARGNSAAMPQVLDRYWAAVQRENKENPNTDGRSDQYLVNTAANLILFQRNNEARTLIQNISDDAYKKEAAEYLSGSKTSAGCEDAKYWWASGRIAFLTYIGAHGIAPGSYQKVPYLDHEVFSQAYSQQEPALVSNTITVRMQAINVISNQISTLSWDYREVRGRYLPAIAAWPNETFQKGVDAEKRQQWTPALRLFLQSLEGDPKRPETLLHLGIVSAQIPGREYRAIAFLKAYLATVPNSDQRPQAEELITKVQQVIQSNLVKDVGELNRVIATDKSYPWCERSEMAHEEAWAGLGDQAMKTNKSKPRNPKMCGGSSVSAPLMIALALGGDVADARQAYAQRPPSFEGSDDDVLRSNLYFSDYDDLLASYLHSKSIKDAEEVYSVMLKHSAVKGRSLSLLVCQEFRSGNVVAAADMLNNLRDTAVAGAKPTQQDDLAAFLGRIARMQVLMGDKKAAQATLDQIRYPDKRKQQTDYAMAPQPEESVDMARVFWLIIGNGYDFVFGDLPAEECWFPQTRANVLTDLAVGGFYIYAKDDSGAGRCMETSPSECIEKSKQSPKFFPSDSAWGHWESSVDALLTANEFLRTQ